jgi:HK97 family phage prohead protease
MNDEVRERAERLFWSRSRPLLKGDRPMNLTALWHRCVADASIDEQAGDGMGMLLAKLKRTKREMLDIPTWAIKSIGGYADESSVHGYLAVFGNEDLTHDVIEPGAFDKTLRECKAFAAKHNTDAIWPLLWQHDQHEPIGGITEARADGRGLLIKAIVNTDCDRGRQAYGSLQTGVLSFSIGYRAIKSVYVGAVRHLKEIQLLEGSVVTFPANREARPLAA